MSGVVAVIRRTVDKADSRWEVTICLQVAEVLECGMFRDVPVDEGCGSRIVDGFKSPQCPVNESTISINLRPSSSSL